MTAQNLPDELSRVHMVGIGGAGMSGIARILLDRGALVSGSDAKESRGVLALRARGAVIRIGHDPSSLDLLPGGPTTVISTQAAIPRTNPELVEARRRGIPVVLRPVVLAKLMSGYHTVMVTGTHGKTTTTSMLIVALQHCGLDPSFAVGGELGEAGTNAHHGSGDYFVAEADESDGSLLEYSPNVVVVTNIEVDHLDFFGSPQAYTALFDDFTARLAPDGALVVCTDDAGGAAFAARAEHRGARVLRYGSSPAAGSGDATRETTADAMAAVLLTWEQQGTGAVAHVQLAGESLPRVMRLSVPGRHMALNALGALVAAVQAGAEPECVLDGLAGFEGVRRRFELVGSADSVRVFDDYAHHPTEVRAVLAAVKTMLDQARGEERGDPGNGTERGRAIVVFQPHLYSRTEAFADEFGRALDGADEVFVLDVYAAREQPLAGVSGATVAEHVSVPVHYVPDFSAVAGKVADAARPGDVVITMGAGDVTMLGNEILIALRVKANRSSPGGRPGAVWR
ncbi:UDP-N-acetylmuramate--L-alanine ligase [Mycobacterium sp.]|jgi:UDP-N-acetylmuramate--alanine ligase|uniref:UDP-N-acetylmuramate--L-alanine ligase n=1 Tax=Mycobacterium sp. TaxID=1785 RepID=UPI002D4576A4|nr:UDP-N-acetylmuramate--L-alanine ligase [Mycobacterium sp.]HZA12783.1 UDP-N-acetylmuramate--L-alanine ligase [Mycobacterium sp.]